jgi:16S rRNA G966 N2-methylase RsmD
MKNHFYISYPGNKRDEVEKIYDLIKDSINENTVIIEPFCGSCALSYYIWSKHPTIKFILNDSSKFLFEMFNIFKNDDELNKLNDWYNDKLNNKINKDEYIKIVKNNDTYSTFLKKKYYCIREGLFPNDNRKFNNIDLKKYPIYNFFKNANIKYSNGDAIDLINKEKNNKDNIIFLDPPYINTCNEYYDYRDVGNIYEYLFNNNINKYKCLLIGVFENNWMIKLLFKKNIILEYDKLYQQSKKKTTHLYISNTKIIK